MRLFVDTFAVRLPVTRVPDGVGVRLRMRLSGVTERASIEDNSAPISEESSEVASEAPSSAEEEWGMKAREPATKAKAKEARKTVVGDRNLL